MFSTLSRFVLLAILATGALAALKDKLDYPQGLAGPFDSEFLQRTDSPLQVIDFWGPGWIPQGCKDRFLAKGLEPTDAEVYNIQYSDCDRRWTFCRHKNAQLSIEKMADSFGRMPVHMRSLIRHPIALPQESCSAAAFTGVGDIVMFGDCTAVSVWLHETGHQLDSRLNPATRFSASSEWLQALSEDTCAPDDYANSSTIEDFAQVTVIAQFNTLAGFKPTEAFPGCLDHRHGLLEHDFRADYLEYGGTCGNRPADSEVVPMTLTKKDTMMMMSREVDTADLGVVGPCYFDGSTGIRHEGIIVQ
ncbi:hypothetical protein ABW20_dc0102708 [Dactylellina cionopaga]|nr:hypothetical protein ABW20_dc0102708 [Dactylellina cionopaga]